MVLGARADRMRARAPFHPICMEQMVRPKRTANIDALDPRPRHEQIPDGSARLIRGLYDY
jgi:hypothetical protein